LSSCLGLAEIAGIAGGSISEVGSELTVPQDRHLLRETIIFRKRNPPLIFLVIPATRGERLVPSEVEESRTKAGIQVFRVVRILSRARVIRKRRSSLLAHALDALDGNVYG
jgi:hypothetical protein